jgi:Carboxypeptidase regulatory-like domain
LRPKIYAKKIFVKKWERLNPSGRPLHLLIGTTSLTMRIGQLLCALILSIVTITAPGEQIDAPQAQRGSIGGTVTDVDDAAIPGATLTVDGPAWSEHRTLKTDETGSFELKDLDPAVAYKITVSAKGFADWTSAAITLKPGQALEMTDIKLKISIV